MARTTNSDSSATASGSRAAPARRKGRAATLIGVAALVAGVIAVATWGSDGGRVRAEFAALAQLRDDGQVEHAAARIAELRESWSKASDDRLERLDAEQKMLEAILTEDRRLTAQVSDPANERGHAVWTAELERLEAIGEPAVRIAAARVHGHLEELLKKKPKVAKPVVPAPAASPSAEELRAAAALPPPPLAPARDRDAGSKAKADQAPSPAAAVAANHDETLRAVDQLVERGMYAQALTMLREELAIADATGPGYAGLQRKADDVKTAATTAMQSLVAGAERALAAKRPGDAVTLLGAARHRFPTTPEFQPMAQVLRKAEALVAAARAKAEEEETGVAAAFPRTAPAAADARPDAAADPMSALRSRVDAAKSAEERGAFADAANLLRDAAAAVRDRDAAFAKRLEDRAADAELLAAWHHAVDAVLSSGRTLKVTSTAGRAVTLRGSAGGRLVGTTFEGETELSWLDVSSMGVGLVADQIHVAGDAALGAAALLYRAGDRERAEGVLARLLQAEPAKKPAIDAAVARGRGEPVDARGYTFGKEGFVSIRATELQKEAQKLLARLDAAFADRDPAVRDKVVAEIAGGGPEAGAVLTLALKKQFDQRLARLDASPLPKQLEKLAEQRGQLDAARAEAKGLIYDEVKYFYPYKPPAVSAEKFAEYNRVQAEVNRLVDAVRAIWKDERIKVHVPASLRADVQRVEWIARKLGDLGAPETKSLERLEWTRALPSGDTIGIRDFCVSAAERDELEEWRHVEAYNAAVVKQVTSSQRELLEITNEYRAMFRHRPLAIVKKLCDASQGHADEMAKLGYFSHMSPTPGRRTPYDRMQLAGYTAGVSENIALHDGALGAHNGWCGSSGHHRNLLDPGHTEMGIGSNGRMWVENFGTGLVHRDDPAWKQTAGDAVGR